MENSIPTEPIEKTAEMIAQSYLAQHPASWVWNNELTSWVAPVAAPTDGFPYIWDEAVVNWVPYPDYPRE